MRRGLVRAARVGAGQAAVLVGGPLPDRALAAAGLVLAAGGERHLVAAHLLDGHAGREDPEVGVRGLGELLLDGLEEVAANVQARVRTPGRLRLEAHRGAGGAAGARGLAKGARRVPGKADEEGPRIGALVRRVLVLVVLEHLHHLLAHLVPVHAGLAADLLGEVEAVRGGAGGRESRGASHAAAIIITIITITIIITVIIITIMINNIITIIHYV